MHGQGRAARCCSPPNSMPKGGGGAVHVGSRRRAARLDAKIIVLGPACEVTSRAVALHCTGTSSYNASHVLDTEANVSGALFWARRTRRLHYSRVE